MAKKKTKKQTKKVAKKKAAKRSGKKAPVKRAKKVAKKKVAKRPGKKVAQRKRVQPVPEGYSTVTPYLAIEGAARAIEFYKEAFGAKELGRLTMGEGKIGHAEIKIGDSRIMLADAMPDWGSRGPQSLGGTPVGLHIYVPNVDRVFAKAVAAGARVEREVKDEFYGDRMGTLLDPFGHRWSIGTHKEDISFKEMQKRSNELYG